jgi:hypothetical protein
MIAALFLFDIFVALMIHHKKTGYLLININYLLVIYKVKHFLTKYNVFKIVYEV